MPTMTTESKALPKVRKAGIRPAWNQIAAVVSIPLPLDRLLQDDLPRASHQAGAEQHENVPPRAGMLGGVQQVGAGAVPH